MLMLGLITPIYLAFSWYYLTDTDFVLSGTNIPIRLQNQMPSPDVDQLIVLSAYLLLTGISVMFLPAAIFGGLIQVRKFASMMFTFLVLVVFSFFLRTEYTFTHLLLLSLPLSVLLSLLIENTRSNLLPDVFVFLLLMVIVASQYLDLVF